MKNLTLTDAELTRIMYALRSYAKNDPMTLSIAKKVWEASGTRKRELLETIFGMYLGEFKEVKE